MLISSKGSKCKQCAIPSDCAGILRAAFASFTAQKWYTFEQCYLTKLIQYWEAVCVVFATFLTSTFQHPSRRARAKSPLPFKMAAILSVIQAFSDSMNGVTFSVTFMRNTETRYGSRASFSFFLWRGEGSVNPKKMLKLSWCILHFHFYFLIFAMPTKWLHLLTVSSSIQYGNPFYWKEFISLQVVINNL